jgi:magnesium-transporting ATPase (P-type)
MKQAIEAWEGEGGARRLPWQSLSASTNRVEKLMPAKINPGTIPIQQTAFLPEFLQLEREPYASSSAFDYLTFGVLLLILHATQDQFRTGWFLESVISASLIVLVIRSRKPFFKSRPGKYLLIATLLVVVVTLILPFTPLDKIFGFVPLPLSFLLLIGMIVIGYIISAEIAKTIFYKTVKV